MKKTQPKPYIILWHWCSQCKSATAFCPKCGNNECNGSAGNSDGTIGGKNADHACPVCSLVHQFIDMCYANNLAPKNKRQVESANRKIMKQFGYLFRSSHD